MKNTFLLLLLIVFTGCEDVVEVDLSNTEPRLVIDANIQWKKGTTGNEQTIRLSTTAPYFDNNIPVVSGATVFVTNSSNTVFNFVEAPGSGLYTCTNFVPVINENYTLTVQYAGQTYQATEKLLATPAITSAQQETVNIFGTEVIQLKYFFQDDGTQTNYYLGTIKNPDYAVPELGAFDDEFFQGNQMFGFYADENVGPGDTVNFQLQGVTLRYFNYMSILIGISSGNNGNPFATPPATLRGNIINISDSENYPLGFFSLGETDALDYTVQ